MTLLTRAEVLNDLRRIFFEDAASDRKVAKAGEVHHWKTGDFTKNKEGQWVPVAGGKKSAAKDTKPAAGPAKAAGGEIGKMVAKAQKDVAAMFPPAPKEPKADAGAAPAAPPAAPPAPPPAAAAAPAEKPPEKKAKEKSKFFEPDPTVDENGDGVADSARVGVPGMEAPPPGGVPRLPNLNERERAIESKFADAYEHNADGMADEFLKVAAKDNYVFETDAAKALMPEWTRPDLPEDGKDPKTGFTILHPERAEARASLNTAMHGTANAIAKKAFLKRLDEIKDMPEEKRKILVTSGGVAGGKGSALKAKPELKSSVSATWDAAGEANATENPWVLEECEKRGIRATFLFVAADPKATWPGAVKRAKGIGRMVDAKVFADSYGHGGKNFKAFHDKNKGKADFVFASSADGKATITPEMDPAALEIDADELYKHASAYMEEQKKDLPPHIYAGGTAGRRIWGEPS